MRGRIRRFLDCEVPLFMWTETPVFREDLENICAQPCIPWDDLRGRTVLVTGATGLIGSQTVSALLYADRKLDLGLKVLALVRSEEKARQKFAAQMEQCPALRLVVGTVEQMPAIDGPVDYIVHGASPTASAYFVQHPVDTIRTATAGTSNLLELAREKKSAGFVYLSSMEVYGTPADDTPLPESAGTTVDTMSARNCYPEAKRLCETMCAAYCAQYGVPATVVRLAQTFGPGVEPGDGRVFAEFARCARDCRDIVLNTTGQSKRCYLYTADAVSAILTLLLAGAPGQAYNAANGVTYCSICEMAEMVAKQVAKKEIQVQIKLNAEKSVKYLPPHHLNLQTDKLTALGWQPTRNLQEMYLRMMQLM